MDHNYPVAQSVAIKDDRIVWVGSDTDSEGLVTKTSHVIDGNNQTLMPGFHDAHIHLLSYATSLESIDCGPSAVTSIKEIQTQLALRTKIISPGRWIKADGYSEFDLLEGRHPTRWDLDEVSPDHPVRLNHRSGHACVLNSNALHLAQISDKTVEPPGATIMRDFDTGGPNGVLLEMSDFLDGRIPRPSELALTRAVCEASKKLASLGITTIQDATFSNTISKWNTFKSLKSNGALSQRITVMVKAAEVPELLKSGCSFGFGDLNLRLGAAKVMVTLSGGEMYPDCETLNQTVKDVHRDGFQVAIHAIEAETVAAAASAIANVNSSTPPHQRRELRHRIEHCSELPDEILNQLIESGSLVVTQPGFIYASGRRYMKTMPEADQRCLYRVRELQTQGILVGFGSDAPVIHPNPMLGIHSAVTRKSQQGMVLPGTTISLLDALYGYTAGSAFAGHWDSELGVIKPGQLADLILLDRDITREDVGCLTEVNVHKTITGGSVIWDRENN